MVFDNYAVDRDSLLSKNGNVTSDGRYISAYKDPNKRFGTLQDSFGGLQIECFTVQCSSIFIAYLFPQERP